jgi:hypothetical protein
MYTEAQHCIYVCPINPRMIDVSSVTPSVSFQAFVDMIVKRCSVFFIHSVCTHSTASNTHPHSNRNNIGYMYITENEARR